MILCEQEIRDLTRKRRSAWQAKELDFLGIPYARRSDGSLIVLRGHVDALQHREPATREPRLRLA
jgi:hypothetical protein